MLTAEEKDPARGELGRGRRVGLLRQPRRPRLPSRHPDSPGDGSRRGCARKVALAGDTLLPPAPSPAPAFHFFPPKATHPAEFPTPSCLCPPPLTLPTLLPPGRSSS